MLLLFMLLSTASDISAQQTYPIYVTPSLTPPYSLILSDYSQIGSQRLVVTIQVRDVTVTNLPVRLNLKIENMTGVTVETIPTAPVTPIFLSGGEVSVLFGDDMRDYFNLNNLQFKGFSKDEYRRTGQLPEGLYRFTVEVRHFQTGRLISNQGTAIAWIALGKPPMLKTPDNDAQLGQITGMPLTFSWVPSPVAVPGVATQYTFEMWEMRVPGIPPAVVAASMPVFYSTTQMNTLLVIPPATLMLEPGMNYAWRVTASDVTGQVPFAQNGQSEVRSFIYQCRCDSVTGFNVERHGQDITYRWIPADNQTSFNVEVENPISSWSRSDRVFDTKYEFNSDPDKTYRARVQAICQGNEMNPSDFTAWQTVNIPAIKTSVEICPDCECGDAVPEPPVTNFNLRYDLQPGDTIHTSSGHSHFIIKSVIPQGNGVYKGQFLFWVRIWGVKFLCDYWDLKVNTDNKIIDYDFKSVDNPNFVLDVDAAKEYVNQVADALNTLSEQKKDIEDILNNVKEEYKNGNITQERYDSINTEGNELKDELKELEQKQKELDEKQEELEQAKKEGDTEKINSISEKYDELKAGLEALAQTLNDKVEDFKQKVGAEFNGTISKPSDSFFDGMIKYSSKLVMQEASIMFGNSSLTYKKLSDSNNANQTYSYEANTVIIKGENVGFYYINNIDSIKKYYDLNDDGYAVFFYFDENNKTISYKIKFKDSFFKNVYGIETPIDTGEYISYFNDILKNIDNRNVFDFFATMAWGLNEMYSAFDEIITKIAPDFADCGKREFSIIIRDEKFVTQPIIASIYTYLVKVGKCITAKERCQGKPYMYQFAYGFTNDLFSTLDVEDLAETVVHLGISQIGLKINCLKEHVRYLTTGIPDFDFKAIIDDWIRCQWGIDMTTDEIAALAPAIIKELKKFDWTDPYFHGQATCFIATILLPTKAADAVKATDAAKAVEAEATITKAKSIGKTSFAEEIEAIVGKGVAKGESYVENLVRYKQLFREGKYTELFAELKKTTAFPKMGKTTNVSYENLLKEYNSLPNALPNHCPYMKGKIGTNFELEEVGYFVRVYDEIGSQRTGKWLFRIEDLRAYKNVDELVEGLALPSKPTKIALVEVPEGTMFRKSIVGEQEWVQGKILQGGGTQYELLENINIESFQPLFNNINDFFK